MQELLNDIVKSVLVASVGLVGPLAVAFIVQLFRKVNIDLSITQREKVSYVVQNILLEVEEWASHRIKAEIPVTAGQKLSRAVEAIVEKVPGVDEAEASVLVRQELPKIGLGAVSFLRATALAASQD